MAVEGPPFDPGNAHFSELIVNQGEFDESNLWVASSREERVDGEIVEVPKTSTELMQELWHDIQERYWFMRPEFLNQVPHEQWNIEFRADPTISVYSYTEEVKLSEAEIFTIGKCISLFSARFPSFYRPVKAIAITDQLAEFTDVSTRRFTTESEAYPRADAIALSPSCFEDGKNKMGLPRLESAIIHELAHFGMDEYLEADWEEMGFDTRVVSDAEEEHFYDPKSDRWTSAYAKASGVYEDIADSAVAYLLSGRLDAEKKDILTTHEVWVAEQEFFIERLDSPLEPTLPEELIYYLDHEIADKLTED